MPVIEGEWWKIADDNPKVSPYEIIDDGSSNTCDFTIYEDAEGKWHAIACVRGTNAPGQRVFQHWLSDSLTKDNWKPQGILEWPRNSRGQGLASLQAPHCFTFEGLYYCFYNSGPARAMYGKDGIQWQIFRNINDEEIIFPMGRDVMLFHDKTEQRWLAYYCGHIEKDGKTEGAMVARTAPKLEGPWSEDEMVVREEGNPESPFVVKRGKNYYLFQQMSVFLSDTPDAFPGKPLTHMTGIWYNGKWAPEVITSDGQDYLAGYGRGLWLAKLQWIPMTLHQAEEHAKPILEKVRKGREAAEQRRKEREN